MVVKIGVDTTENEPFKARSAAWPRPRGLLDLGLRIGDGLRLGEVRDHEVHAGVEAGRAPPASRVRNSWRTGASLCRTSSTSAGFSSVFNIYPFHKKEASLTLAS